ncbi:MAG: NUDIX domain-containing protein [archaeon]
MKIPIVNENDEIIKVKDREKLNYKKDIYRVSALWITNSKGKILLARRALTKKQNPGKWGPAVAGTVEDKETYESNIIKEAEEELELKNIKPKKGIKELVKGNYNHFTQWFYLKLDKDINNFSYSREEVAEIRWFTKKDVLKLISTKSDEVLKEMKKWINLF